MKISKLEIREFRHLKNLEFDFTYPLDYKDKKKAGRPLEKICFIGQSATGKTNLLELIKNNYYSLTEISVNDTNFCFDSQEQLADTTTTFHDNHEQIQFSKNHFEFNGNKLTFSPVGSFSKFMKSESKPMLSYFKANLISENNLNIFTKNPVHLFEQFSDFFINHPSKLKNINAIILDHDVNPNLWLYLLTEILEYRKKFNQKMSELIHKGLLANQKRLSEEFDKWQIENPNALEKFAEKFNPILKRLNLEVDIVDTEYSIPLRNKITDEIIPIQSASTGTKGLLLTILPLYQLDTDNSIILMDEPERSLYPDMQMDLIDYYQTLAPNAQFIIATHSPFIAASFEPEERFILYFDEKGKVKVRRGNSPIGDDPNDILKNDFGINYYNKHGEKAYKDYLTLKQKIANEENQKKKKELLLEMVKLGDEYNF